MPGERVIATLGDGAPVPAEVVSISSMRTDISPPPRSAKLMRLVQQLPAVEDPAPDGQTLYQLRLPDGQMAQAPGAHLQRYPQVRRGGAAMIGVPMHRPWACVATMGAPRLAETSMTSDCECAKRDGCCPVSWLGLHSP